MFQVPGHVCKFSLKRLTYADLYAYLYKHTYVILWGVYVSQYFDELII